MGAQAGPRRESSVLIPKLLSSSVSVRATTCLAGAVTPAYRMSMGAVSTVEWVPVESGLFSSAAYRASVRQLYLRFQDGKIYRFFECPAAVYSEFVAATSKGRYFSQQIRNRFRYEIVCCGSSGRRGCASPQPSLAEQLKASVVLAKA